MKYSIDRLIGYIPEGESEPKLLLCEMKGRVASTKAQEERERVQRFHNSERFISTSSNSHDSCKFKCKASERLQVFHYYHTYEQERMLHIVGDTQKTSSGVTFSVHPDCLESYAKVLSRLCNLSLKLLCESPTLSQVVDIVKERIHEGIKFHRKTNCGFPSSETAPLALAQNHLRYFPSSLSLQTHPSHHLHLLECHETCGGLDGSNTLAKKV